MTTSTIYWIQPLGKAQSLWEAIKELPCVGDSFGFDYDVSMGEYKLASYFLTPIWGIVTLRYSLWAVELEITWSLPHFSTWNSPLDFIPPLKHCPAFFVVILTGGRLSTASEFDPRLVLMEEGHLSFVVWKFHVKIWTLKDYTKSRVDKNIPDWCIWLFKSPVVKHYWQCT